MEKKKKVVIPRKTNKGKTVKKAAEKKAWIESHARLMRILEASGMALKPSPVMLPRNHDR